MKKIKKGSWVKITGGKMIKAGTYAKVIDELRKGIFLVCVGNYDNYVVVKKNLEPVEVA